MITRSPVRPHICLQCQRNLSKRIAPSKSQSTSFHQTASISNGEEHTSPPAEPQGFKIHRIPAQDQRRSSLSSRKGYSRRNEDPYTKPGDQFKKGAARLHGHRGRKLQEKLEDLNTNSLGDAAKVIVLHDSKYNFYTHLNRMKDQPAKHVDIESLVMKEMGTVDPKEVTKSIDGLKKGPAPQTWEELNEVVRVLSEGFTYSQLLRYLEFASALTEKVEFPEEKLDEIQATVSPSRHISNVTSWMPGISNMSDHFDEDPLRGYYMPSHTSKQKIALKVIRECWKWDLPEVSEGLGQFEVQMSKSDLDLLTKGPDSPLTQLHGEYLAHEDEAMEVFPSRGILRITTMRHKRQIVVDILKRDLDSIQREAIFLGVLFPKLAKGRDFETWQARTFSDSVLQELSHITSTEISRVSKNTLLISCFLEVDKPGLSSRIDTVKRLLTTASDAVDHTKYSLESNTLTDGMFISYPQVEGLNWREKMRKWVRWTAPVTKSKDAQIAIGDMVNEEESIEDEQVDLQSVPTIPPVTANNDLWGDDIQETSALFGNIIHTSLTPGRDPISPFDSAISVRRGFSTLVPNLSRFLQNTSFFNATENSLATNTPLKHITLRFLPDPFQIPWQGKAKEYKIEGHSVVQAIGTDAIKHLPHIDMRFSVSEDNSIELKDVLAVLSESKSDVMLPSNGVDVRFQNRTTRRMKHTANMESLQDFVSTSIFDLRRGRMLTPPTINLPINPELLSVQDRKALNSGSEPQQVQYMFAGLEVRSTLVFNWKEWRVLYTSIEAGQAGGRRGELKLRPINSGRVTSKHDFIKAANKLAHELGDTTPGSELVFGSPAPKIKTKKYLASSADEVPQNEDSVPGWGVDNDGLKRGKWTRSPALFRENATKDWFANQALYDEPSKLVNTEQPSEEEQK